MYYHASKTKDIKELNPNISNHNKPLIYFSSKYENVLVYLSNAITKTCLENNLKFDRWTTWASYGFEDGILVIEEYYPNATYETYKGVSGYIYYVNDMPNIKKQEDIKDAYITDSNVIVDGCIYVEDAYEEIMKYVEMGKLKLLRYEEITDEKRKWIYDTIKKEYANNPSHDYKYFLLNKFDFLKE